MSKTFKLELNEDEIFLVLQALGLKVECTTEDRAKQYKALHDRIELIYEERV